MNFDSVLGSLWDQYFVFLIRQFIIPFIEIYAHYLSLILANKCNLTLHGDHLYIPSQKQKFLMTV